MLRPRPLLPRRALRVPDAARLATAEKALGEYQHASSLHAAREALASARGALETESHALALGTRLRDAAQQSPRDEGEALKEMLARLDVESARVLVAERPEMVVEDVAKVLRVRTAEGDRTQRVRFSWTHSRARNARGSESFEGNLELLGEGDAVEVKLLHVNDCATEADKAAVSAFLAALAPQASPQLRGWFLAAAATYPSDYAFDEVSRALAETP
jgi:hypothetical protein